MTEHRTNFDFLNLLLSVPTPQKRATNIVCYINIVC
jgi:hypothetical protein